MNSTRPRCCSTGGRRRSGAAAFGGTAITVPSHRPRSGSWPPPEPEACFGYAAGDAAGRGRVSVVGGDTPHAGWFSQTCGGPVPFNLASSELYDPRSRACSITGGGAEARRGHTVTPPPNSGSTGGRAATTTTSQAPAKGKKKRGTIPLAGPGKPDRGYAQGPFRKHSHAAG